MGLYFDIGLRWKHHVTQLKISCHKVLNVLKHLSDLTWRADRVSLLRLYIMLVKPKLYYGCEAYSLASKLVLEALEPIHNAAIRIVTGAFKSSLIISLNSDSGLKLLKYYRGIRIINHLSRIYVNNNHPLHEIIISGIDEVEEFAIVWPSAGFVDRARQLQQQ